MMWELAEYFGEITIDAVFPHRCSCGRWGEPICGECLQKTKIPKTDLCPICKRISEFGRTCSACRHRSELTGVMIVGAHEGVLKDAIWRLKYGSVKGIATVLADLAEAKYGQFIIEKRFLITSAPMTKQRIRFRGFNQAEEIAKALAKRTNMLYLPSLSKLKDTGSQVGRSRRERLRSLSGTFEANITPDQNKKILVVDDVYTSGATLEESARALRAVGFREVWGLTITRD